jgi:hypothetical protein
MGSCDRGYEHFYCIKGRGFFWLSELQLIFFFSEITVVSRISQFTFIVLLCPCRLFQFHTNSHMNGITNFIERVYFNHKRFYNGWDNAWTNKSHERYATISVEAAAISFRVDLLQNCYSCSIN